MSATAAVHFCPSNPCPMCAGSVQQLSVFDTAPPRPVVDTPAPGQWDVPSARAATKARGFRSPQHERIFFYLTWLGTPALDEDIADAADIGPSSIRPRLAELQAAGVIVVADREGRTKAGNQARRWRLA